MNSASVKPSLLVLSTMSRKLVMAATGLFLCSFLVVHLGGNLMLLLPEPDARLLFNTYAATLSANPLIKTIAYGLYASILIHVGYAVWIAVVNRRAAGSRYAVDRRAQASDVHVPGGADEINSELKRAGRVADYLELGELVCRDALHREESCGAHFREEHQTEDGEAVRDDERFAYVSCWEHAGEGVPPVHHAEPLHFDNVQLQTRDYQ